VTGGGHGGAADPGHRDEVVRTATGRGWDEWRELIDAWPGRDDGHAAVVRWLQQEHAVDGWWAQAVAVGWERLSGRRLPHQVADGTFTANRSATMAVDAEALGSRLRDPASLPGLFPGTPVTLRSRASANDVRLGFDEGVAVMAIEPRADGRVTVHVSHEKLASPEAVQRWKAFWGEWLDALATGRIAGCGVRPRRRGRTPHTRSRKRCGAGRTCVAARGGSPPPVVRSDPTRTRKDTWLSRTSSPRRSAPARPSPPAG
jgi:hypothetical protein